MQIYNSNGFKAYYYPDLIKEMPNILEHPEDYAELKKDLESIGFTKQANRQQWLNKLKSFVNNYIIERHVYETYGFDYDLQPLNETFHYLEIRNGYGKPDFYSNRFGNKIEVKTYKSSSEVFNCAIKDIEFIKEATDWQDYINRKDWLWSQCGRYVQIYDADVVWFVIRNEGKIICYNVKNRKSYVNPISFDGIKLF